MNEKKKERKKEKWLVYEKEIKKRKKEKLNSYHLYDLKPYVQGWNIVFLASAESFDVS